MAKKKKEVIIPKDKEKEKLFKLYLSHEYGMMPYNAAVKAGYNRSQAIYLAKINDPLDIKNEKGQWDGNQVAKNIFEQEGFTIRRSIRRMVEKAGLVDNIEGANKVISAVEVPDEDIRFKYHMKLNEMVGLSKTDEEGNRGSGNIKPYSIQITILSDKSQGGNGKGVEIREI